MKADIILGLQWGDEGKGKIVDLLAAGYPVVARFQGGPNAGHSIHFEGRSYVLRSIPSGVFRDDAVNVIGNGVVLDPITFKQECEALEASGVPVRNRILISRKAHLILPTHRILDAASEAAKGASKIGSTLKGIGPTYMDKTGRNGLRVGDIEASDFMVRFNALREKHYAVLRQYDYSYNPDQELEEWLDAVDFMRNFRFVDSEYFINGCLSEGRAVLCEGAQGTLLDVDFGSYPFVTSSSTVCAGACTGLGLAPNRIGEVYGIFKAYCTRVGSGPFPTELFDGTGEEIRRRGFEFGAVTKRPRRTGWLDLVALKYAVMIDGVTSLIMMKADVLEGFDKVKVATSYIVDGKPADTVPFDTYAEVEPVYTELEGWGSLEGASSYEELPETFRKYVAFIEKEVGVPVKILSVGPDRDQTIFR